jgi:rfaE bifunctional protein kinase chain/domain
MDVSRFATLASRYKELTVAVIGDYCLDRYLEIDPERAEISLETGLEVHNVLNVRAQPGAAGTIVNNLAALGVGTILPIGFVGEDGEGLDLYRALEERPGVQMRHFIKTDLRRTFTYCKPLVVSKDKPPIELNRLDFKNWTPTPAVVQNLLAAQIAHASHRVDAMIVLDQVDLAEMGVVTMGVLEKIRTLHQENPQLLIVCDSRRGLANFPPVTFKMNARELAAMTGTPETSSLDEIRRVAVSLAVKQKQNIFVTLAERGILAAHADGESEHVPALPVRGQIDIVGAGDAVTANLTMALAAGGQGREVLEIANAAASVVVHKLGTTGTASAAEIERLLLMPA